MRRKKPGRRSMAELAVTQLAGPVDRVERPEPPYELNDEESEEWRQICASMPADWFGRQHWPMLSQLCRNIVAARKLSMLVHQTEKGECWDPDLWLRTLKAQETISKTIAALCSKMRLAHISVMRQDRTAQPPSGKEPWLK